jgi:hypothetical protein
VWVNDPDGAPWEVYTVLADAQDPGACADGACEVSASDQVEAVKGCC